MDPKKTGRIIKEKRISLNLTQKDLAKKLFITDKAISKWERGLSFPDISILIPLTNVLNISLYDLLKGENMNKLEAEDVLKNTIEYSNEEIKHSKRKTFKLVILTFTVLILLISIYIFASTYELPVIYNENLISVNIPEDKGIDIKVKSPNYKNTHAILVKTDENSYDLYINITETLMTKLFKDNDKSNNLLRIGNSMIIDFQSGMLKGYIPNGNKEDVIKRIFYVNKPSNSIEIMSEKDLTDYKDKKLIWERD